jgi:hypothetical protein
MAKSLIIGAFTKYNYNQLKSWVESIDRCGFDGDRVMIVDESTQETVDELIDRNFHIVAMNKLNLPIHVSRFLFIYAYLKDCWQQYDYVVTTDVKDVYFQTNPITWLENNLGDKKLVAGSESIKYKDEPWGKQNLYLSFGPLISERMQDNEIYNAGTVSGKFQSFLDLCTNIFLSSGGAPANVPGGGGPDQAALNVLLNLKPYKDITNFAKSEDGYAAQLGTTADPKCIQQNREFLLGPEPKLIGDEVCTSEGTPFAIVHQYDRIPEWKEIIEAKYA